MRALCGRSGAYLRTRKAVIGIKNKVLKQDKAVHFWQKQAQLLGEKSKNTENKGGFKGKKPNWASGNVKNNKKKIWNAKILLILTLPIFEKHVNIMDDKNIVGTSQGEQRIYDDIYKILIFNSKFFKDREV